MTSQTDRARDGSRGRTASERGHRFTRRRSGPGLPPHLRLRRRRLLLASAPIVVLLLLAAARLVTLNIVHAQTLAGFEAGDRSRTLVWADRQGWLNVVERFRAPFAVGDAHVLGGHFDLARPWFEEALELVPKGDIDECKVRVNLGLTYERLGDEAKERERTEEWRQFYERGIAVTRDRPPLCDAPEGGPTGQQLEQAQERMEQKNSDAPDPTEPDEPDEPSPGPQATPTPDPDNTPSERRQQQLQQQQRQNTIERHLRNSNPESPGGEPGDPQYPKPW